MSAATAPSVTLVRRIEAPVEAVYEALTDPKHLARWWARPEVEILAAETDPRVGGAYRIRLRGANGAERELTGVYRELIPNKRIAFTWLWSDDPDPTSLVTIDLKPQGGGVELTLIHTSEAGEAVEEPRRRGWTAWLDRLQAHATEAH